MSSLCPMGLRVKHLFESKADNIYTIESQSLQMVSEPILELGVGVCLAP